MGTYIFLTGLQGFWLSLIPVAVMAVFLAESRAWSLVAFTALGASVNACLWCHARKGSQSCTLTPAHSYTAVVMLWVVCGIVAAVPFVLLEPDLPWEDAIFAAFSGITTTGAEVFNLELLPKTLLMYRHWLQFLGGLGIVMLLLFLFPLCGLEGVMSLKMDMPGPVRNTSLPLRRTELVRAVWSVYVGMFLVCAGLLKATGLTAFEATAEALSIVSTGGFGLYNDNIGHYTQWGVPVIVMLFSWLSAMSFVSHIGVLFRRSFTVYWQQKEHALMLGWLFVAWLCIVCMQSSSHGMEAVFMAVSMLTTSGYTLSEFYAPSAPVVFMLLLLCCFGGATASTAGGFKQARLAAMWSHVVVSLRVLVHPMLSLSQYEVQAGSVQKENRVFYVLVQGYAVLWMFFLALSVWGLLLLGVDTVSAAKTSLACLTNTGASIGGDFLGYTTFSAAVKGVLVLDMLLGRLEFFPAAAWMYVLLTQDR